MRQRIKGRLGWRRVPEVGVGMRSGEGEVGGGGGRGGGQDWARREGAGGETERSYVMLTLIDCDVSE